MKKLFLEGCGTALLTPFKGAEVDYDCYASLVDRQVEAGIDILVPLGTTAETPCLSVEEKLRLLAITKQHAAGRPIVVGGGTNSLVGTVKNMRELEPYSPDAYLIVAPYYNKPTQEGLFEYFKAVAETTDKGIVLYNVPGRTGVNICAETTLRLAEEVENVIAIKEASSRYSQISEILRHRPEGFSVLSGNDNETLSLMATGAQGVISVASNIAPALMVELTRLMKAGDLVKARELHHRLSPLFRDCFIESNPIPAKAAMAQLGLMENSLRLPLVPATQRTEDIMRNTLKELLG